MILLYIAVAIVAILSAVAVYYCVLAYKKTQADKQSALELDKLIASRKQKNINSVVIIARAVLDDQVTLTEASIRINALLPTLNLSQESQEALSVFRQLAEATSHIPILDRWKALSRKEKAVYDKEREEIESKFSDFVKSAAEKIVKEKALLT